MKNKFTLGEFVQLVTDPHKQKRQVIGIYTCVDGGGYYSTVLGSEEYKAYESELEPFKS